MAAAVLGPAQFAKRLGIASLFHGLGEEPLLAIAKHAVLRSLRRGQILWKYRSHAYELAFVWDGHLQVRRAE